MQIVLKRGKLSYLLGMCQRFCRENICIWAQAGVTILAVIVAFVAIGQERGARHSEQERQARQQARKVAAWRTGRRGNWVKFELVNSSDEPVFLARIRVGYPGRQASQKTLGVIDPNYHRMLWFDKPIDGIEEHPDDAPELDLIFTDAASTTWRRHTNGKLVQYRDPRTPESDHPCSSEGDLPNGRRWWQIWKRD